MTTRTEFEQELLSFSAILNDIMVITKMDSASDEIKEYVKAVNRVYNTKFDFLFDSFESLE